MKNHKQTKIIAIIITLCFQPLLMAKTIKVEEIVYSNTVQISKSDIVMDILVAISHTFRAITTTSKELDNADETKEVNWFLIGVVVILALASIMVLFKSDEE